MPDPNASRRIDKRLRGLFERHRPPDGEPFAISVVTVDGADHHAGAHDQPFPLQSISKVLAYAQALEDHGRERVLEHVGVEPSGEAFNSIVFDERHHRPYNPMVNAGALVTTDLVAGADEAEKLARLLDEARAQAGEPLEVDEDVVRDELGRADHNRSTAYLMRSQGMLDPGADVEALLELYLRQCAITVTTRTLAVMAATLANAGVNPRTGERALTADRVRDVLSVMHTCGMYDYAGQWAYEIGVPAKSGVSGGIMVVVPGKGGVGVFSPELDEHGNSILGIRVCRDLSERLGLHIFAAEAEDALFGGREVDQPGL